MLSCLGNTMTIPQCSTVQFNFSKIDIPGYKVLRERFSQKLEHYQMLFVS